MKLSAARSWAICTFGRPQPWWVRVRSELVPVNVYCFALLMASALIVAAWGCRSNTVPPVGLVFQTFSDHICTIRPTTPAASGVAAEVPPNVEV